MDVIRDMRVPIFTPTWLSSDMISNQWVDHPLKLPSASAQLHLWAWESEPGKGGPDVETQPSGMPRTGCCKHGPVDEDYLDRGDSGQN